MYPIAYIVLFLIYAIMALVYNYSGPKNRSWIKFATLALFIFFFGFKGFIGDDWLRYAPYFNGMYYDNIDNIINTITNSGYEMGFSVLQAVCKLIYPDYFFFIFVCTVIKCALLYNFLKNRVDNLPFAFMVFICMSGTILEINYLRNSLSILIYLNALTYLIERKPLPYFGLCFLAMSFHISSVLYLPLYFILHKTMPRWAYITIFSLLTILLLAQISLIAPALNFVASFMGENYVRLVKIYTEGAMGAVAGRLSIGVLERLMTGVLIICYYNKLVEIKKENILYINAFLLYFLSFAILREFDELSRRIAILFVFSYWVLWCDLLKCFFYKGNRLLYTLFFFCYGIMKVYSSTNEPKFEYDNILLGAKSYEERYTIYMINKKK